MHKYSEADFIAQVTTRNQNLITTDQQAQLRHTVVAFFGLSVGSHAVLTWGMQSRAGVIKIADHDTISLSNLNRLRFGVESVGKMKTEVVKDQLLAINPYCQVIERTQTDHPQLQRLLVADPMTHIIVDEIDSFEGKIFLRQQARSLKIPLISVADVGDNIMVDIERYDLDNDYPFFHGRLGDVEQLDFSTMSPIDKKKMIVKLIGFEHNSAAMLQSLLDIGKTIETWPQLGATATISGGVVTTLLKKIVFGERVNSGRYYLSLDEIFVEDYQTKENAQIRQQLIAEIKRKFQL